jgi:hypothetical protein
MRTRSKLAGLGLMMSWILNAVAEFFCRWVWGSGAKFPDADKLPALSQYTAPVYLATSAGVIILSLAGAGRSNLVRRMRFDIDGNLFLLLRAAVRRTYPA